MVINSDFILQLVSDTHSNPLFQNPIFSDRELLSELKKLVHTKASTKMSSPTVIPQHTLMKVSSNDLIRKFEEERREEGKREFI